MTDQQDGFEFQGAFYPFKLSDGAKDLQLIDRLTGMGVDEFFEVAREGVQRGPMLLALVATSLRAAHPDWSVERIMHTVNGIESVDEEITLIEGDEAAPAGPPAEAAASSTSPPPSDSPVDESLSSSTQEEPSPLPTLSAIRH